MAASRSLRNSTVASKKTMTPPMARIRAGRPSAPLRVLLLGSTSSSVYAAPRFFFFFFFAPV